ncbi:prepilin-type N-terminal cleavage/methylation domain-containing protein [Methylobacterium sp. J-076]|uniref:prepilin-type N-terminal cleavage/methylation domain-containing protein n=1 Tax=Methylobacterium sp. J-076 TaxID=2836655 RepID=UPI001FB877AB|nr:prepilin-type N-terminal cleavage/methylation domain-containing protein [Methylobacterium sp. J-076]MCJ2011913.1 prepilin-type N-terminal cleavage/methylation domain-containing protein [Methylobacterium sp. J-076]
MRAFEQGYVLLELMLALMIVSLLAGLALPRASATGGASELWSTASRIAVLLRTDRNAALRGGQPVVSGLDREAGAIRSGSSATFVVLPPRYRMLVSDTLTSGVRFDPDGHALGGEIAVLNAREQHVVLRIDPVSAAIVVRGGEAGHAP